MSGGANIRERLFALGDERYAGFQSALIPNIPKETVIGVRMPMMRKLAKEIAGAEEMRAFLAELPHTYYDENILHSVLLSQMKDYGTCMEAVEAFLPHIDNWAVCDCFCWRLRAAERQPMWEFIQPYFHAQAEYDTRFAVVMGLGNFVDERHLEAFLRLLDGVRHEAYYARMAVAWAVSVCYIKFPQRTHEWLGSCSLDDWTFNKSLQKIVESLRVSDTDKQAIRAMKRRKQATSRAAVNPRPGTETAGQAEKRPGQAPKQPTDGKTAARRRRPAEKQGARHRFAK